MTFHTSIYGNDNSDILLLQMVDEHELETIDQEISFIKELSPEKEVARRIQGERRLSEGS